MVLSENYLMTTKNLEAFFNAVLTAQAPKNFTQKFLEQLEFRSSNDRLFLGLLKSLGFLDANGVPTDKYFKFLDQSISKKVLSESIMEAYSDLFSINKKAYELSVTDVKNKFKTLTQGSKSDNVLNLMANTFVALCKYADWDSSNSVKTREEPKSEKNVEKIGQEIKIGEKRNDLRPELHYNIQIHLPESRDVAVYDALFRSLKEHLL